MGERHERIAGYDGETEDHPTLAGRYIREDAEGTQLWPDGSRYVGAWKRHLYRGERSRAQLLFSS